MPILNEIQLSPFREWREKLDLSLEDVSAKVGLHRNTISYAEHGRVAYPKTVAAAFEEIGWPGSELLNAHLQWLGFSLEESALRWPARRKSTAAELSLSDEHLRRKKEEEWGSRVVILLNDYMHQHKRNLGQISIAMGLSRATLYQTYKTGRARLRTLRLVEEFLEREVPMPSP
jgi:transcriptional regulator with XRE-family HTH domain